MSKYLLNEADKKELVYILGFYIHDLHSNTCALDTKIRLLKTNKGTEASVAVWEGKIDKQEAYAKKLEELRDKVKDLEVSDE